MRQFLFLIVFLLSISLPAQTIQYGYVKTKGRIDNQGQLIHGRRLGSVSIVLSNGNSTVSGDNGDFSLTIPDTKFYLKNVQKQGYVLTDLDMLAKQYIYSNNPFVITMETLAEQTKDHVEAQKKIEAILRQRLQQREEELEAQKTSNRLSEAEYYKKLQQLYDEKATENLVREMSKRYADIDYDLIDNFQRQFCIYILDGDLQKADSLLETKGNLSTEIYKLKQINQANIIEQEKLERRQQQLDSSISYAKWLMEDIANRCYNKAEIFQLQYRWDSVVIYLKLRSKLDPFNIEWLYDAGSYMYKYTSEYDTALKYFNLCEKYLKERGDVDPWRNANIHNNIGIILYTQGNYTQALNNLHKALQFWEHSYGECDPNYALSCNNIGLVYQEFGQYDKALQYYKKALQIQIMNHGETHPMVATCYNNLGNIYEKIGNLSECKKCHEEALRIWKSYHGSESHSDVATTYINLGNYYRKVHVYSMAKECYNKALDICKDIYEKNPLLIAECHNNLGSVCIDQNDFQNAEKHFLFAESTLTTTFGDRHPMLVVCYLNLGQAYINQGIINSSLLYFEKAYHLSSEIRDLAIKAQCCYSLGFIYDEILGDSTKALKLYSEALEYLNSMPNPDKAIVEAISETISIIESR